MKETRTIRLNFKSDAAEEPGSFAGLLSPYGNVDEGGDRVLPSAFKKWLNDHGPQIPILWSHDPSEPVGTGTVEDKVSGLWVRGRLLISTQKGRDVWELAKAGVVNGLSIGYTTIKDSVENGVRNLVELKLYECSLCVFPMNPEALITSVKFREKSAIEVQHTAIDKESAWDKSEALNNLGDKPSVAALRAVHAWVDSSKPADEKSSYKLPHHNVSSDGRVGAANMSGVAAAMARLNSGMLDIPEADRKGVYAHLKAHYDDAKMEAPDLKSIEDIELKYGARHSAATKAVLNGVHDRMMECCSDIRALLNDDDEDDGGADGDVISPGKSRRSLKSFRRKLYDGAGFVVSAGILQQIDEIREALSTKDAAANDHLMRRFDEILENL